MSFLARGDNMPISDDEEQRTQPVVAGAVNNADHMRQGGTSTLATVSTGARSMKTPTRSFYHQTFHGSFDPVHYSSHGVREQTAEFASLALSDAESALNDRSLPVPADGLRLGLDISPSRLDRSHFDVHTDAPGIEGPTASIGTRLSGSALTEMIRVAPPDCNHPSASPDTAIPESPGHPPEFAIGGDSSPYDNEETSLLRWSSRSPYRNNYGSVGDVENQWFHQWKSQRFFPLARKTGEGLLQLIRAPKMWDGKTIWRNGVIYPLGLLPAVFLGLLLNILDALSYGMILFPLGEPLFQDLGSDGISIFYVSTIISQLVFSCGASIFRGGIGSEMIEVVPFFHKMAFLILSKVGPDNPHSVLATTILSFSFSSVLTGLVFFLMGACKLGSLIGFFPRHILIGCIGGVGWFLIATGVEVSARLPGSLEYNLRTLHKLFQLDTVFLWMVPLLLSIGLLIIKRFVKSNFLVGGYFIVAAAIFYLVTVVAGVSLDQLRDSGWVFAAPAVSNPWYHFYTLYDMSAVNWSAFADTIPAMFALTFFGVLHVPINVPALGISTGEDNLNVDRELMAHGISNALSGFAGSIQNYLAYTNSLLFIDSGGNSRLAGIMLAFATAGIMFVGPVIISFIPIMVVGALIFMLGIELMEEALIDTYGKLHKLEYLTVLIIVVTMGAWDFVIGIFAGIILACFSFVVQTSRKSAIRAIYSGEFAGSTVRRHPVQQRFLRDAGQQTLIIKLAGYLFFGTIVRVETTVRGLIDDDAFALRPIRFLVLDFCRVNGLDFSSAEALTRINRIIGKRHVQMIISGLVVEGEVGKSLQNVGLFDVGDVQLFEDLNSALEFCENEYLKVFYSRKEAFSKIVGGHPRFLDVPTTVGKDHPLAVDPSVSSPRRHYLNKLALSTLQAEGETPVIPPQKWGSYRPPLPLLLQTFQGLTTKNEDFWFRACPYFHSEHHPAGYILYHEDDEPTKFYLLESGMLRAEYTMPQGGYSEVIVAGRPCGELPFFGRTRRTAVMKVEQDCVLWCLDREKWEELKSREPDIAQELLTITLKLTAERMDSITSHVLTIAG